jgi:hypothetical protein
MSLSNEQLADMVDGIRARCGKELAALCEQYRERAHEDFESAETEEGRIRAQAASVIYRDMAEQWRGAHEPEMRRALADDRTASDGAGA